MNTLRVIGLCSVLTCAAAQSCEYHSMPNFGVFGGAMAHKIQPHMLNQPTSLLSVNLPLRMTVEADAESVVELTYTAPLAYRDVTLAFSSSDYIVMNNEQPLSIEHQKGTYALNFQATEPGRHEIKVTMNATKEGELISKVMQMQVTAF